MSSAAITMVNNLINTPHIANISNSINNKLSLGHQTMLAKVYYAFNEQMQPPFY